MTDFTVFLRGISNIPMQPLRDALTQAGLENVRSFGGTGNLLFRARTADRSELERRIAAAVGTDAFVRDRADLTAVVSDNPFAGRAGASVFFSHAAFDAARAAALLEGGFEGEPPVLSGAHVYFVHPLRRVGHAGIVDLERELGARGTMRAARVVARVLELL